jgi:hypothetical protein
VTSSADVDAAAGVVGYLTGSASNVVNAAAVSLSGAGVSETGGVAGVAASTASSAQNVTAGISESANIAPIAGRSRLGGVAGAIYAAGDSSVSLTDSFNTGAITAHDSQGRAYVGGVVGYSMGAVGNSYNQGDIATGSGDIYAGGIAGLLNGAAEPYGSIADSYNTGAVSGSGASLQALYGYADNSSRVTVTNSVYLDTMRQAQLGATWSNVNQATQAFMQSPQILNAQTYLDPASFGQYSSDYPVLVWQTVTVSSGAQGDFAAAMNSLNGGTSVILISDFPVNIPSSTTTIDIGGANGKIYRAPGYIGDLFTVTGTGLLQIVSGVIDGNTQATGVIGSLVSVGGPGASLAMSGGTLQNNTTTGNGGAVFINVGTVTMTGGTITGNATTGNGNGIYVSANNQLTLSPGGEDAITFGAGNDIYLPGGVSFDIGADLGAGVSGTIGLTFGNPNSGDEVAITQSEEMSESSIEKLVPSPNTVILDYDGTLIYIADAREITA